MSLSSENTNSQSELILIYDGNCPFCHNYVHMLRLKKTVGTVLLINARNGGEYVDAAIQRGLDLNEGMALFYAGVWYHGSDCMNILALLTAPIGVINKLTAWVFKSPSRARRLYPALRLGRNFTLKLLGKRKINQ